MAVLQKMREKFGVAISVIIALSLLYFIAPMDDLMTLFGRPQNVGEINGRGISYEDFLEEVDKYTTISEIASGSSVTNEQTQKQVRDMAWQSLLDEYMFIKNAKAAGVRVGTAEALDIIKANIPEDQLTELTSSDDERIAMYWNYIQNSVAWQQYHIKYNSMFVNSAVENPLSEADIIAMNNTSVDYQYVEVPFTFAPDSTIKVSSSEIRKWYKANRKDYKQGASRDIEYVVYEVTPSAEDRAATAEAMQTAYDEFKTAGNVKSFLLRNSDRSYSEYWFKKGELKTVNAAIDDFAFSSATGVSEIIEDGDKFYAAKVVAVKQLPDSVYVKHILLQGEDADAKADSLLAVVSKKGASFSLEAMQNSADRGSQADGEIGNIGWLTQTYMIPGLESVLTAEVGKPYIAKTQYGTHIVLVSKKTAPIVKKQVAILEKDVLASKETFNAKYTEVNRFASIAAGSAEGYRKAVDSLGVYSHPFNGVTEGTESFGSVDQAKEVTRWIFDNKAGKASDIITVNNNFFFVVAVNAVHKEGFTPVAEVAPQIRQTIYAQKRSAKEVENVRARIEGLTTLEEVAETLGSEVETKTGVSLSTMGMAVEPAVAGIVSKAEIDAIARPVAGVSAVYVCKVTAREVGEFYTAEDAANYSTQKAQYTTQMILPVMMENADVKDNRARYY